MGGDILRGNIGRPVLFPGQGRAQQARRAQAAPQTWAETAREAFLKLPRTVEVLRCPTSHPNFFFGWEV